MLSLLSRNKYINKIGVELEGVHPVGPKNFPLIKSDCSVKVLHSAIPIFVKHPKTKRLIKARDGEINSPAYQNKNSLKKWVAKYFPIKTNETCGYHIHVSFKKDDYRKILATKEFHYKFIADVKQYFAGKKITQAFQNRLEGNHNYCNYQEMYFNAEYGTRALRFYTHHHTMEFRIFSMTVTPKMAQEIIDWLHGYIETEVAARLRQKRLDAKAKIA